MRSDVGHDSGNMQFRQSSGDSVRLSVSSALSSSHSSGHDDYESLGDVYVWGELWCDAASANGSRSPSSLKTDVLLPKPLELSVVLDVHQIACGARHAALVTRQGEVFTWGEGAGGRLGHGNERDISQPLLVESLAVHNMDLIACGEYHTSAISMSGDVFTWGDGAVNAGLLGHGTGISHWIPKQISGLLEGLQVLFVACGSWHSALITSNGKLFTFGDGTFGALGHGDHESVFYPREVKCLNKLMTFKVACGMYHTAAIVEVTGQLGVNVISRKLFTWGDGAEYRLGHGDKDPRLVPTCVSALFDYNFHQLACGHTMTVALTTSGHVFTMGSTIHGQLGNPQSDGKHPCLVQDKLVAELVEEISCGAFHVAVLTSRTEVYTWGNGANGRLGHGDTEDRRTPALVEALKDRHVKSVACGSNFTTSICIHKWVSGTDQSVCSGCRQAFGFTRKRRNCYNCGLVHCHACSSKKAMKAALAPIPGKPHRVCDSCYAKLKASESASACSIKRKKVIPHRLSDSRESSNRMKVKSSKLLLSSRTEPVRYLEGRSVKYGMKTENASLLRASQVPSIIQFPGSLGSLQGASKPIDTTLQPCSNSRPVSPHSRRPSPPRSISPVFSGSVVDNMKTTNELLNQEVLKMQAQIKSLKDKCDKQDQEMQMVRDKLQRSATMSIERDPRRFTAKELILSLAAQLKNFTEKLPPDACDSGSLSTLHLQVESFLDACAAQKEKMDNQGDVDTSDLSEISKDGNESKATISNGRDLKAVKEGASSQKLDGGGDSSMLQPVEDGDKIVGVLSPRDISQHNPETGLKSPKTPTLKAQNSEVREVVEQFQPGVYITLAQFPNGVRAFKRVRFSKRRFAEQQAEIWWKENRERVYMRYNYMGMDGSQMEQSLDVNPNGADPVADAVATGHSKGSDSTASTERLGSGNNRSSTSSIEEDKGPSSKTL